MTYVEVLISGDTSWWHKNSAFQTLYLDPRNNLSLSERLLIKKDYNESRKKQSSGFIRSPLLISLSNPSPFDSH